MKSLLFTGKTDVGQRRTDNQDAFICSTIWAETSGLLAVIDGVGGYAGGDRAAAIAKESIEQYMATPNGNPLSMLREAVVFANNQINTQRQQEPRLAQMCCVLTTAVADTQSGFRWAFVVKFKFDSSPAQQERAPMPGSATRNATVLPRSLAAGLAELTYYIAELNKEDSYLMRDREIVVARKEPENQHFPNYLLLESAYVSNPHARIRYDDATQTFQLASFSRNETRVNEQLILRSEPASPQWYTLPDKAQILLNSMVTLHFQRTL